VDAEQELVERWHGWQASIEARDLAAATGYLADDYALELVQPERAVVPRDAWLALLPDYVVSGYTIEAQIVEVSGDIGLILHRARQEATVHDADRSDTFVLTDIWRRIDGTWRGVASPLHSHGRRRHAGVAVAASPDRGWAGPEHGPVCNAERGGSRYRACRSQMSRGIGRG